MSSQSNIKVIGHFFHPQNAKAAQELAARIRNDQNGAFNCNIADAFKVRDMSDVEFVHGLVLDCALSLSKRTEIIDFHRAMNKDFDVHYVARNLDGMFEFVETPEDAKNTAKPANTNSYNPFGAAGASDESYPRPGPAPASAGNGDAGNADAAEKTPTERAQSAYDTLRTSLEGRPFGGSFTGTGDAIGGAAGSGAVTGGATPITGGAFNHPAASGTVTGAGGTWTDTSGKIYGALPDGTVYTIDPSTQSIKFGLDATGDAPAATTGSGSGQASKAARNKGTGSSAAAKRAETSAKSATEGTGESAGT